MPDKKSKLKFKQFVHAPVDEVFSAFTNATALCEWLCNIAQADAHEGGRLYVWWNSGYFASGEFIRLKPFKKIVFSWHGRGEPAATRVRVSLAPKDGGTKVSLEQSGMSDDKTWRPVIQASRRGWQVGLENLKSVLETGLDLRFVRMPLLGVAGLEPVSPEQAAELGLPKGKTGLRIHNVVEGLGAQAAGLHKDDILTKLAGRKLAGLSDVIKVVRTHKAGEKVTVQYYRGGEKQRLKMTLSSRYLPEIPATAAELAENTRQIDAAGMAALRKCLDGASEMELAYKPGPDEWSSLEVLAHLIATERDTHAWISGLIEGQEADFIYHVHQPARAQATLAAIPTLDGLLEALESLLAETAAMVAGLPAEFVQRKRSYWRLGYNLLQSPAHFQEHCAQIASALKLARTAALATQAEADRVAASPQPGETGPVGSAAPVKRHRKTKTTAQPDGN